MFRVSPRRSTPRRSSSGNAADELVMQVQLARLPTPTREYRFHPTRKWKIDVALVTEKIAIEIDGGVFLKNFDGSTGGRHNRGAGYRNDIEKLAELSILGWRTIRCLPEQVVSGQALVWIERCVRGEP